MDQNDRQFIVETVNKALKEEVPKIVQTEIKTALDASNKEMKQFIIEHVSNEINDLAMVTANQLKRMEQKMDDGFDRVDKRIDDLEIKVDTGFNVLGKKVEYIGENYTKDEIHNELDKRVKKLELSRV